MTWEQLQREALEWGCRLVPVAYVKGRPPEAMTRKEEQLHLALRQGPQPADVLLSFAGVANADSLKVHLSHLRTKLPEGQTITWSRETRLYSLEKINP